MINIRVAPMIYKLFFVFILMIALLPFKYNYHLLFGTTQISYSDFLLVLLLGVLLPLLLKKLPHTFPADKLVLYFYFILIYGFVSTFWADRYNSYWYTFYMWLLAVITVTIPYLLAKMTNDKHVDYHKLISNFSVILSLIFFIYIFQSDNARLGGYLGGAALIGAIMIPTLAIHFHNLVNRKRIISSLICFFITLFAALQTESRVTLVMLILYLVITLLRKPTIKRLLIIATLTLIFGFFLFEHISTERYQDLLVDTNRTIAFESTIEWATHSPQALFFGNGFGTVWQWHAFQLNELPSWHFPMNPTEHGYLLFHAHSVFNQLFAELGLIGTIPFIIIIYQIIKITWRSWLEKNELKTNIMVAIICSLPALFSDLLIFRNWETSIVWLFFVFTAINYTNKEEISAKIQVSKK